MNALRRYVDRVLGRQRAPEVIDFDRLLDEAGSTFACRGCGKRARFELTPNSDDGRREYLCADDLGPFLDVFADPRIGEWTVVRL